MIRAALGHTSERTQGEIGEASHAELRREGAAASKGGIGSLVRTCEKEREQERERERERKSGMGWGSYNHC